MENCNCIKCRNSTNGFSNHSGFSTGSDTPIFPCHKPEVKEGEFGKQMIDLLYGQIKENAELSNHPMKLFEVAEEEYMKNHCANCLKKWSECNCTPTKEVVDNDWVFANNILAKDSFLTAKLYKKETNEYILVKDLLLKNTAKRDEEVVRGLKKIQKEVGSYMDYNFDKHFIIHTKLENLINKLNK